MSFICEYIKDELKESLLGVAYFKIDVLARLVAIFTKINFLEKNKYKIHQNYSLSKITLKI